MYSVVDDDDSDGNDAVGNALESIAEETSNVANSVIAVTIIIIYHRIHRPTC